jgi:hypothetical protein
VPSEKLRRPKCPVRSGRLPNVMEISGRLSSPQKAKSSIPSRLGRRIVVLVVDDVLVVVTAVDDVVGAVDVVVVPGVVVLVVVVCWGWVVVVEVLVVGATVVVDVDVLVGTTVEVVVVGAVVELVVVLDVVVVPPPGRHSDTSGSGWPVSKAITLERPCWSAKNEPIRPSQPGMELTETEIGFWPV